jgi:hypothetical protein
MRKEDLVLKAKEFDLKLKRHPMSSEELQEVLCNFAEFIDKDLIDNVAPSEIVERFLGSVIKENWRVPPDNIFSKEEIIKRATERANEMSKGDKEEDKRCIYNYAQGMLEMQYLLLNE